MNISTTTRQHVTLSDEEVDEAISLYIARKLNKDLSDFKNLYIQISFDSKNDAVIEAEWEI
jgi:hypothetical protein